MVGIGKKLTGLLIFFLFLSPLTLGWFEGDPYWTIAITAVNGYDTTPESVDNAPDGGSVKLPLTVWINLESNGVWELAMHEVRLQYKVIGKSGWIDTPVVYNNSERAYKFKSHQFAMGSEIIKDSSTSVDPGDSLLIRLYIAHHAEESYRNAPLGVDTTEEGTNGWRDAWVVLVHLDNTWRPIWNDTDDGGIDL